MHLTTNGEDAGTEPGAELDIRCRDTACVELTCLPVPDTVIWRVLKIHEVVFRGLLKPLVGHGEARAVLVHDDLDGAVVLPPQVVARSPKVGHGQPARPQRARAAHAVTLALLFQEALHSLAKRWARSGPGTQAHDARYTVWSHQEGTGDARPWGSGLGRVSDVTGCSLPPLCTDDSTWTGGERAGTVPDSEPHQASNMTKSSLT